MRWYFASRVRHKEALQEVADFLKSKGETIQSEWLYYHGQLKPYEKCLDAVVPFSKSVVDNCLQSDVFVLISDPAGTDMFIELGICLAQEKTRLYTSWVNIQNVP